MSDFQNQKIFSMYLIVLIKTNHWMTFLCLFYSKIYKKLLSWAPPRTWEAHLDPSLTPSFFSSQGSIKIKLFDSE